MFKDDATGCQVFVATVSSKYEWHKGNRLNS